MPPVLTIKNLTKVYDSGLKALDGVDLEIGRGEIFALLGPNGAGKTTLISVVCGLARPTEGTVTVAGQRSALPALLRRLNELDIGFTDLNTRHTSLEDILVGVVGGPS